MPLVLGGIVMWSSLIAEIPDGWQLCDGTNGTLDLRNRFIIGAGDSYSVGATGGNVNSILVEHTHSGSTSSVGNHGHYNSRWNVYNPNGAGGFFYGGTGSSVGVGGHGHSHTASNSSTAGSDNGVGKNLPPYYALAFIQQIA